MFFLILGPFSKLQFSVSSRPNFIFSLYFLLLKWLLSITNVKTFSITNVKKCQKKCPKNVQKQAFFKNKLRNFSIFFRILSKWLPSAAILNELFLRKSLACPAAYGGWHGTVLKATSNFCFLIMKKTKIFLYYNQPIQFSNLN